MCCARGEVAQLLDQVRAGNQLRGKHELEEAESRLAELPRDRPARPQLQNADRGRATAGATRPDGCVELGPAVGRKTPESDSLCAGQLESEA